MIKTYKKSTFRLLTTMILVSMSVTLVAIVVIFNITLHHKKTYLKKLSDYEHTIIRTFYNQTHDIQEILYFIREQQETHPGLEETGEFIISQQRGDSIFLIQFRGIKKGWAPLVIPANKDVGGPSQFAALRNTGYFRGTDYSGRKVLAYCEYIPELNWGISTKIDYSEILKPFYEASIYAFIAAVFLVLVGTYLFKKFTDPLFQRISESEEKYRRLFEFLPSGITITDKEGAILEGNKASEILLGTRGPEPEKKKIDSHNWKIIHPDGTSMPPAEFAGVIAQKENRVIMNQEIGILSDKNKTTWLNVSATPFPLKNYGIILVYNDITSRIEAEKTLKEHDKKLEAYAQKLKSLNDTKDKFFRIIAHDLKNPFGSLLGASEYLNEYADKHGEEKILKLSKILHESAKSGYDILVNLLEWSRSQTSILKYNPATVDLQAIIRNNVNLVSAMANAKDIDLTLEAPQKIEVYADANMLNTVLRNLLTNAIKFTQRGGKVSVSTNKRDGKIIVSVNDTGTGIPQKELDKLFRIDVKYVTTGTENEKGTGLGLILCKEFINQHGGKIWIKSEVGQGSTFYFSIPA